MTAYDGTAGPVQDDDTVTRRDFVRAIAQLVDQQTAWKLYDLFNQIALLHYEACESTGALLLSSADSSGVELAVSLVSPLDVHDVRGMRKLLQVSSTDLSLLCDGTDIYGFGRRLDATNRASLIEFQSYGRWRLSCDQDDWLHVDVSAPQEIKHPLSEPAFKDLLQKIFGAVSRTAAKHLWELIVAASHQANGTNVLIAPNAAAEVCRLRTQCTLVAPTRLSPHLMERITAIDGTVIIDLNGVCHAMGAILDGNTSRRGDRTRGGRYNSALMYVDSCRVPCLIVVVSQDGLVDYVYASDRMRPG